MRSSEEACDVEVAVAFVVYDLLYNLNHFGIRDVVAHLGVPLVRQIHKAAHQVESRRGNRLEHMHDAADGRSVEVVFNRNDSPQKLEHGHVGVLVVRHSELLDALHHHCFLSHAWEPLLVPHLIVHLPRLRNDEPSLDVGRHKLLGSFDVSDIRQMRHRHDAVVVLFHLIYLRHRPDPFEHVRRKGRAVVANKHKLRTSGNVMHAV